MPRELYPCFNSSKNKKTLIYNFSENGEAYSTLGFEMIVSIALK
jgi:hypothetical protein